jgi:hypothetical protein
MRLPIIRLSAAVAATTTTTATATATYDTDVTYHICKHSTYPSHIGQ